ncbi:MAG: PIN domain-containing protein [Chitinophagaceae bacterium]
MDNVFVDTDISLDLLTNRQPYYSAAAKLFTMADRKAIKLHVSSLSFSNLHYILRSENSATEARRLLSNYRILVNVLVVNEKIIDLALQSLFKDFEDAIQYFTAIQNNVPVLLTRNLKDYKHSAIPVMTADDYLKIS